MYFMLNSGLSIFFSVHLTPPAATETPTPETVNWGSALWSHAAAAEGTAVTVEVRAKVRHS